MDPGNGTFGEQLTKERIPDFDMDAHMEEYKKADKEGKAETYLGKNILSKANEIWDKKWGGEKG